MYISIYKNTYINTHINESFIASLFVISKMVQPGRILYTLKFWTVLNRNCSLKAHEDKPTLKDVLLVRMLMMFILAILLLMNLSVWFFYLCFTWNILYILRKDYVELMLFLIVWWAFLLKQSGYRCLILGEFFRYKFSVFSSNRTIEWSIRPWLSFHKPQNWLNSKFWIYMWVFGVVP